MKVRTNTPLFLEKVDAYYKELFQQIAGLQVTRGGPVIMMQVENEYGSFGNDKEYLRQIKGLMEKYGAEVPLFTSDGAWDAALEAGSLIEDGVLATANFGFYNGCSARGNTDLPQITSYNYDAVLTEWGEPTDKFYQVRQVVRELFPELHTGEPRDKTRRAYGRADITGKVSLLSCLDDLAECKKSAVPMTMEEAGKG